MGYTCPQTAFLQLKHYIQKIYLIQLSTTCVKIRQIPNIIFQNISPFSGHTSSVLFQLKHFHNFDKNISPKCKFSDFSLLELKSIKFLMPFFKQKVIFCLNFRSLFSVMRDNSSVLFQLKLYMISTKGAYQSAKFQTFDC